MDQGQPLTWSLEDPDEHFREHDRRQVRYWLSRPPSERLAQAARYRYRVHGEIRAPKALRWHFVDAWGDE